MEADSRGRYTSNIKRSVVELHQMVGLIIWKWDRNPTIMNSSQDPDRWGFLLFSCGTASLFLSLRRPQDKEKRKPKPSSPHPGQLPQVLKKHLTWGNSSHWGHRASFRLLSLSLKVQTITSLSKKASYILSWSGLLEQWSGGVFSSWCGVWLVGHKQEPPNQSQLQTEERTKE